MKTISDFINETNEGDTVFIWNYKGTLVIAEDMHEFFNYLVNEEKFDADDFDEMVSIERKYRVFSGKLANISKEISQAGYFWRNLK